jgi:predicted DNA-binding protein (UPF0251 family)
MPRPHKRRRIGTEPLVEMFKPAGVPARSLEQVELRLDELEALRLADLEGLYQDAAAERMGVSRSTFGRLVAAARSKVADALLNSKGLVFKGGCVTMAQMRMFECEQCGTRFEERFGTGHPDKCPSCGSTHFCRAEDGGGGRRRCRRGGRAGGPRVTGVSSGVVGLTQAMR